MWYVIGIVAVAIALMAWSACAAGAREDRMNATKPMPERTIRDQFEREVEQVMRDTGMEKMQAIYHVRARNLLRASSASSIGPRMKPQHDTPPAL